MRLSSSLVLLALVLAAFAAIPAPPAASAPLAQTAPGPFGVNSHIASRHPVYETLPATADAAAGLGVGWVREDFQFSRIQPQGGAFDWSWHDRAVELFAARGVEVVGLLNGPTPGWASGRGGASFAPPDPLAFARFAQAAAARYRGKVRYWQVWNEPDNARYWQPAPSPAAYAELLKAAYPAIKAGNPDAQVIAAGLVAPQPAAGFLQQLHAAGAWGAFDIIAVHPYTDPLGPEDGQIDVAGVGAVRGFADSVGPKPIWATEFGWSTGPSDRTGSFAFDEGAQANYLVRGALLLRAAGAERVAWYNLKDTHARGGVPYNLYGLLRYDPATARYDAAFQKQAYRAFQVMAAELAGTGSATRLDLTPQATVLNFEQPLTWRRGNEPNGTLAQSGERVRGGTGAAKLSYSFPSGGNDYVVFLPPSPVPLPDGASRLGVWVYGDGSGHGLKVWLRDREGEVLQYRLGPVGGPSWQFIAASLSGDVPQGDVIANGRNRRLDLPASLTALVLDDDPDSFAGAGAIYLDDMTAATGPDSYGVRFSRGGEVVDVVWAPAPTQISLPTQSAEARRVRLWGEVGAEPARDGRLTLAVGPDPIYLRHVPANVAAPAPAPVAPAPAAPSPADQRCFPETGFCIAGRIRQYWEQNGGLPVFGFPIGPQRAETIEGRELQVQWFERNRLELHPENARPYDVLLGRLGADALARQGRDWQAFPQSGPLPGCRFFAETGQSVCGLILERWRASGVEIDGRPGKVEAESLALLGLPLSPLQTETIEGKTLQVQWFERGRLELHPENAPPFNVLLGLLGREVLGPR
jgi:hypothetical protein